MSAKTAEELWAAVQAASGAMKTREGQAMLASTVGTAPLELVALADMAVRRQAAAPSDPAQAPTFFMALGIQIGLVLANAAEVDG